MESIDPRKQKRLGPAPIASFEKSFEDNSQGASPIGLTGNIHKQNMDTNCGGNSDDSATTTVNNKNDNNKGYELKNINPSIIKYDRPKVSPPDPPQHQHPKISVSIPSKKLHDIGKRPPPPPLQCSSIDDRGGGGGDGDGSSIGSNIKSGKVKLINTLGLNTPLTPRIDISRASSSSQHGDSRDSSPENVFEQVGTGTLQEAIGLGFREEGAFDLKSSTEELYFMDPEQKKEEKEKMQQARKSPIIFKFDDHQTYLQQHQRKDSASSEVAALLCISGRTSRISSVGSQGSAVSRLSAISGVSGISRSPSPHRMLLETSFCGPKPLENIVDGSNINSTEPNTSETLEQVLLSRKHDQTSVVLAEGIKIESSPKRKMLANGGAKKKTLSHEKATSADYNLIKPAPKTTGLNLSSRKSNVSSGRRGSGKQVIGVTESGTKYIRINLKPDHLYPDKGIAPNEKIIEVSSGGPGTTSISNSSSSSKIQDKPSTLHINRDTGGGSDRLTPSSSPKPARHIALVRETGIAVPGNGGDSRSPSPGNVLRKSSFCSLFKTAKDSPDSPRDRSRSKSRDLITPQSQSGTPNKQKSVLAIFKPKRSGSKSKCSSPIDQDAITAQQLDGLAQVEFKFNSEFVQEQDRSRPASRLRYYDTPLDGKSIHIPLHTPPEEKDLNKILPGHQEIKFQEQPPTSEPAPGPSGTKPTVTSPSFEATSVTIINRPEIRSIMKEAPPALPVKSPKPLQLEKIQRIENLDAIQTLPQDVKEKERTWSLEVQRHSSQDSQDTVISANGSSGNNSRKPKTNLDNVIESPIKENGLIKHPQVPPPPPPPKVINVQKVTVQQSQQQQHLQQQPPQPIQSSDIISKEKKRILFATRIGSGSQEQIFSTQFSLSKTESLSSQLSEQISIPESPAEGREAALHRSDTVIRRPEEFKKKDSIDDQKVQDNNHSSVELSKTNNSADERSRKSKSSEDEDKCPVVVMMRRKDSSEESRRKSKSASEEDDATHRHSKYLENFDVRKQRFQDNQKRQSNNHNSSDSSIKESNSRDESEPPPPPKIPPKPIKPPPSVSPLLPPPPPASDRQSVTSTDDPAESSESERDSESSKIAMDPNRIKRHLPRHIGVIEDHESTGLVSQESFDDELPYVPTTLPEERPQGVALIPMKERAHMEMKTFSLDRPRSTTPLNPTHLEEYCGNVTPDDPNEHGLVRGEKLRISLPRKDSNINKNHAQKSKSPRRPSNSSGKSWFEFAEQGIRGTSGGTTNTTSSTATITTPTQSGDDIQQEFKQQDDNSSPPPPPLPPRKPSSTSISSGQWINFENIPEKRKAPKRITALPKDTSVLVGQDAGNKAQEPIHYNYVKPEECQCECHEVERESNSTQKLITNVDLLQQGGGSGGGEDMQPLLDSDCHEGIYPSDSSQDYDYNVDDHQSSDERRRYEIDTPSSMRNSRSNRSSGLSDDHDTSPDQKSSLRTTKRSNNSTRNQ